MTAPTEIQRVSEAELVKLALGKPVARLPYHFPACPTGTCAGCDAHEAEDARRVLAAAS